MSSLKLENLIGKKICILGLGIENYALLKYLSKKKVKAEFIICDRRLQAKKFYPDLETAKISWKLGNKYDRDLEQYDIISRVAGYPLFTPEIIKAKKSGAIITSPVKLFFTWCPTRNIIGVTGTKGKGTTASLIFNILKSAGKKVYFGGNIGYPMFAFLDKIKLSDWVVLELSSFQLEDLEASPCISVITNFTEEHLAPADPNNPNYHRSLNDYWRSKLNIAGHQERNEFLIINSKLEARVKKYKLKSKIIYFKKSELDSQLPGEHNKENIAAAVEVAKILKIKKNVIGTAVKKFSGLPHRLELVGEVQGVKYYDDSFGTTPEAGITALQSFSAPAILLAGGADKGSDFKNFSREIKKRVKFVILLEGQATPRLRKNLLQVGYSEKNLAPAHSMREAIRLAKKQAEKGDIVLLAPVCASFGMFKNYKDRGDQFKQAVKNLSLSFPPSRE